MGKEAFNKRRELMTGGLDQGSKEKDLYKLVILMPVALIWSAGNKDTERRMED